MDDYDLVLSGSANQLVKVTTSRFMQKIDEAWSEAIPNTNTNSWVLRTRAGLTYTFGGSGESRVVSGEVDTFHSVPSCSFTTAWYATKVADTNGNIMTIEYEKFGNTPIPKRIYYGGTENSAGNLIINHPYEVEIVSEALSAVGKPIMRSFSSGAEQRLERRIKEIIVRGRETSNGTFQEIRRYTLHYDDSLPTQEFLLSSVSETETQGASLPTRTFNYSGAIPTIVGAQSAVLDDPESLGFSLARGQKMLFMDLNGDGILDRIKGSNSGLWIATYGDSSEELQFWHAGGDTWANPPGYNGDNIIRHTDSNTDYYTTIDLDGDSIPDFVARDSSTNPPSIRVYKGSCTAHFECGFASTSNTWNNPGTSSNEQLKRFIVHDGHNGATSTTRDLLDMTGDGLPDIVRADSNGSWRVYRNNGEGFDVDPIGFNAGDNDLTFSRAAEKSGPSEVALIDINSDGLPDRISIPPFFAEHGKSRFVPTIYFVINSAGVETGPYQMGLPGGYLCPPASEGGNVTFCNGVSPPSGSAIVPAVSVQLNTGNGFSPPVYSPAPFWNRNDPKASRLRHMTAQDGGRVTKTIRDFLDVNGDGRLDWVVTGREYPELGGAQEDDWYVLFNLGDGRFGGGLTVYDAAAAIIFEPEAPGDPEGLGVWLGKVHPTSVLPNVAENLGRTFQHVNPSDRNDVQMSVMDIDGDGVSEWVQAFGIGGSNRWDLKKLSFQGNQAFAHPHTKPLLLLRIDDGIGGRTEFEYSPSVDFAALPSGSPAAWSGGMPFPQWVVTGIRRTDGLCPTTTAPTDWFTTSGNPCLAQGHETVQSIVYRDAKYDGEERESLGFREVTIQDAPIPYGGETRITYFQDPVLKGRVQSQKTYIGGAILQSQVLFDWATVMDWPRTQVYVREQRVQEVDVLVDLGSSSITYDDQCVVHRNSIQNNNTPDPMTRVHRACTMSCTGAGQVSHGCGPLVADKKQVDFTFATATGSHSVWDRPSRILSSYVNSVGAVKTTSEVEFYYDDRPHGEATLGRLTRERKRIAEGANEWTEKYNVYDVYNGQPVEGPGNITSVRLPRSGSDTRENHYFGFDSEFRLFPTSDTFPNTIVNGSPVTHVIQRAFDYRHGQVKQVIGLQGSAAGDISGTEYDSLGRPLCQFEPGTNCSGTGFVGAKQFLYQLGNPNGSSLAARMNAVTVRIREPSSPTGYLEATTYTDALGRERISIGQQATPNGQQLQMVVIRQVEYGPNGKPVRSYAPYVPTGSIGLSAPTGTPFASTSYVFNGNTSGWLDPAGRAFSVTGFDGGVQQTLYIGTVVETISPEGNSRVVALMDSHGRVIQRATIDTSNQITALVNAVYDGADHVLAEWFGGNTNTMVTKSYDMLGRVTQNNDPDSGVWSRTYDWVGNVLFSNDPKAGSSVQSCFDQQDRVVLQCARSSDDIEPGLCTDPNPSCSTKYVYKYDETSNVAGHTNMGTGRITTTSGANNAQKYLYDVRGRVRSSVETVSGITATTAFQYRADIDRLERMTYPDGEIVTYSYNVGGQPWTMSEVNSSDQWLSWYIQNVEYDIRGRATFIQRGNNTSDYITYHGASENFMLASMKSQLAGFNGQQPTAFVHVEYDDYDKNGRLKIIDDQLANFGAISMEASYSYDAGGRLIGVAGANPESFAYDTNGNMTTLNGKTFAFGNASRPHQATGLTEPSAPSWSMTYNDNGQRTGKVRADSSVSHQYGYDGFGNLTSLTVAGATKTMHYDHAGQRVSETRDGVTRRFFGKYSESKSGLLMKFYYFGGNLVATRADSAPQFSADVPPPADPVILPPSVYWGVITVGLALLLSNLIWTPGRAFRLASPGGALGAAIVVLSTSLPIAISTGCGSSALIHHYHMGHLGGPIAVTDSAGTVHRQYRYSAYGEVRRYDQYGNAAAIDLNSRREYTGYETDEESGLQYASARFYDPALAQFLSLDPVEVVANPFAYVGWDPINRIDPNGTEPITAAIVAAATYLAMAAAIVGTALMAAQAIHAAIRTGNPGEFFAAIVPYVGTIRGIVAAPGNYLNYLSFVPIVGGIATGIYGVNNASSAADSIFAGIGLAVAVVGAALAVYSAGAKIHDIVKARAAAQAAGGSDYSKVLIPADQIQDGMLLPKSVKEVFLSGDLEVISDDLRYPGNLEDTADAVRIKFATEDGLAEAAHSTKSGKAQDVYAYHKEGDIYIRKGEPLRKVSGGHEFVHAHGYRSLGAAEYGRRYNMAASLGRDLNKHETFATRYARSMSTWRYKFSK